MKAEINNENKARFFALYWGQHVWCSRHYKHSEVDSDVFHPIHLESPSYLGLKPLSSISDEDAIDVARLTNIDFSNNYHRQHEFVEVFINEVFIKEDCWIHSNEIISTNDLSFCEIFAIEQFLRSRGYALPWMGLSVEEMIAAGWIKLVER